MHNKTTDETNILTVGRKINMLSEEKVMEKLESRYRMFIRTNNDKFLY